MLARGFMEWDDAELALDLFEKDSNSTISAEELRGEIHCEGAQQVLRYQELDMNHIQFVL